ncbi:MAG: hypothetical protein QG585_600 [Patescibacteria group bacterium]|jgi:hypothetical protein|nr:hypothetical protein [Patescibacteria group bacterium]
MKKEFSFSATVEKFNLPASWYFVMVPEKIVKQVKELNPKKIGYGFYPSFVTVRKSTWRTSLLPMGNKTGEKRYFIALKAQIRKKEGIGLGEKVKIDFVLE